MSTQANNELVIVKKYANRRLYNTQTSCYITLEDLFDMVKRGEYFEVRDAKTEEDLTRSVLTQIIFEQESKGYNLLPISFLRQLIGLYGNSVSQMLPNYLDVSMENFVRNQEKLQDFTHNMGSFTPLGAFENIAKQNMKLFEDALGMFNPNAAKKNTDDKKD